MTRLSDSDWAILRESEADARCFEGAAPPVDLGYEAWAELLAAELPPQELPEPDPDPDPELPWRGALRWTAGDGTGGIAGGRGCWARPSGV